MTDDRPILELLPAGLLTVGLVTTAGRASGLVVYGPLLAREQIRALYALLPEHARCYPLLAKRWACSTVLAARDFPWADAPHCPAFQAVFKIL